MRKTLKKGKRRADVFVKPYDPCPIKLTKWYELLECDSDREKDETSYSATTQQWSGYTPHDGMYKAMFSPCEEESMPSRPHRGGRCRKGRQVVGRENSRSRHHQDQQNLGRQEEREKRLARRQRERELDSEQVVRKHKHTHNSDRNNTQDTNTHTQHNTLHSCDPQTLTRQDIG